MRRIRVLWGLVITLVATLSVGGVDVFAQTSSSTNYKVTETQFGAGSNTLNCSSQYCSRPTIGDVTNAQTSSSNGNPPLEFDPLDVSTPSLDVIIESGVSNLGVLSTEETATKTMIVKVRNYLSGGYVMQMLGSTPHYGNYYLDTLEEGAASSAGTEQFAINLAANTMPAVGASAVQVPSSDFSFGVVEPGYDTPNVFKYNSGDVIARSQSETGRTDYTISMIVNVASSTPSGHYSGDFSLVIIPAY